MSHHRDLKNARNATKAAITLSSIAAHTAPHEDAEWHAHINKLLARVDLAQRELKIREARRAELARLREAVQP